jgi:uncharacterized protein (UPF0218 family)
MANAYSLPKELRVKLKEPLGRLIRGSFAETMNQMEIIVKEKSPLKIISVGDTVSRNLHERRIIPQLAITDNKSMRKKTRTVLFPGKRLVHVSNPPGTITEEAIVAVKEALNTGKETQIIVEGEEDLLTLIAVEYAPEKSLVVYGQPHEGIVLVEVTPEKKTEARAILKAMKNGSKS